MSTLSEPRTISVVFFIACPLVPGARNRLHDTSSKPVTCLWSAPSNQRTGENTLNRRAQYAAESVLKDVQLGDVYFY